MPWCILYSSMVSLNNLCVLHGPAGWGESSGCAKPLWAHIAPSHAGEWMFTGRCRPVITFLHPPAAQGDGGSPSEAPQHFSPCKREEGQHISGQEPIWWWDITSACRCQLLTWSWLCLAPKVSWKEHTGLQMLLGICLFAFLPLGIWT